MGTPAPPPPPRLVGREAEIRVLAEALDRVASGLPSIVPIEGEAGIGKSRVLEEALQDARGRGMQVVAGRAMELEQARPFGVPADRLWMRFVVSGPASGRHRILACQPWRR
jgi:hypothetical protein